MSFDQFIKTCYNWNIETFLVFFALAKILNVGTQVGTYLYNTYLSILFTYRGRMVKNFD